MSECFPSSSDSGQQENPPRSLAPRWQRGCYRQYSVSFCGVADCPYLHDLNAEEVEELLLWKQQEQQHLVFNSRSNSNSNTTSNSGNSSISGDVLIEGGSITELIDSAARIPSMGPKRQQLIRRLNEHFLRINDEELRKLLPRDDAGRVTSIGGLFHETGRCRACRNMVAGQECGKGIRCGFCHFPHDPVPQGVVDMNVGDKRRNVTRPCKVQRDKYRKHVERIEEQIRADPWNFDPMTVDLPASIFDGRPEVRSKFLMRLSSVADTAKAERESFGRNANANAASSSQAVKTASINQAGPSASSSQTHPSASTHEVLPAGRKPPRNIVHL